MSFTRPLIHAKERPHALREPANRPCGELRATAGPSPKGKGTPHSSVSSRRRGVGLRRSSRHNLAACPVPPTAARRSRRARQAVCAEIRALSRRQELPDVGQRYVQAGLHVSLAAPSEPNRQQATPRARPNPSLKRRPATAGGLGRPAALVHHRPAGQAHLPPRSP